MRLKLLERASHEKLERLEEENRRLKQENERLAERAVLLEDEARWLKAQFFGRSSERSRADVFPEQKRLFNEADVLAAIAATDEAHAQKTTQIEAHERKRRAAPVPEQLLLAKSRDRVVPRAGGC